RGPRPRRQGRQSSRPSQAEAAGHETGSDKRLAGNTPLLLMFSCSDKRKCHTTQPRYLTDILPALVEHGDRSVQVGLIVVEILEASLPKPPHARDGLSESPAGQATPMRFIL